MGKPIFVDFDHLAEHFSPLGVNRILIGIRNLSAYGLHKFSGLAFIPIILTAFIR
jgi:hypothetical protein